jgi:hypothetical protein
MCYINMQINSYKPKGMHFNFEYNLTFYVVKNVKCLDLEHRKNNSKTITPHE